MYLMGAFSAALVMMALIVMRIMRSFILHSLGDAGTKFVIGFAAAAIHHGVRYFFSELLGSHGLLFIIIHIKIPLFSVRTFAALMSIRSLG
jgi:hypothetical protein